MKDKEAIDKNKKGLKKDNEGVLAWNKSLDVGNAIKSF